MIHAQEFSPPPPKLCLRLLVGSVVAAAVAMTTQAGSWQENLLQLERPDAALGWRCGASLVVALTALLLALCLGLGTALVARQLGTKARRLADLAGRALACLPVAALAWGFVGVWTGRYGLPVETLMPAELPLAQDAWQTTLARQLWAHLAPALLLALPLMGEVLHSTLADAAVTTNLEAALVARGVPAGRRLWHHHLRQMLPLVRARLQGLCLVVPAYLILIEEVLHFMGWGGWMAQAVREAAAPRIALGFLLGGGMAALLCLGLRLLLPGRLRCVRNRLSTLAWQPWLLWVLGLMALPPFSSWPWVLCWCGVLLLGSAAWHETWMRVEKQLPLLAAKMLGATEAEAWAAHAAPVQWRMMLAWMCTVLAQTLIWAAAVCAVQPRLLRELHGPLAAWLAPLAVDGAPETARILADPTALLLAGGGIALAALCLIQVGRMIQPRSPRSVSSSSS